MVGPARGLSGVLYIVVCELAVASACGEATRRSHWLESGASSLRVGQAAQCWIVSTHVHFTLVREGLLAVSTSCARAVGVGAIATAIAHAAVGELATVERAGAVAVRLWAALNV